jgi:hypothetical protein
MKNKSNGKPAASGKPASNGTSRPATEFVRLKDLTPHPRNYRKHPEDQLAHIVESIRQHGFYRNIVVANDGTILAGHGVVEAALKMNLKEVPVIRVPLASNDPLALKIVVGDNEISKLAEPDDRVLTDMLKELKEADTAGLLGTGFDDLMLSSLVMVTRTAGEVNRMKEEDQWRGMPEFGEAEIIPKLTVCFRNKKDRDRYVKEQKMKPLYRSEHVWTVWWPHKTQDDLASVKFKTEKPAK